MWILFFLIVTIYILFVCLNSVFSFKKYNLIIWRNKNNTQTKTIRYIFDGWTDTDKKNTYHGSLSFLESEASADRTTPSLKTGGIHRLSLDMPEIDSVGTQAGSVIEIEYFAVVDKTEMFENFFKKFGVAFHRAEPFYKPVKTLWQIINELFGRQKKP